MARLLLDARYEAGLTQRQVAARLHKPGNFPHIVEHGERELNIVELLDYCEALGLDFAQFTTEVARAVRELRQSRVEGSDVGASPTPSVD